MEKFRGWFVFKSFYGQALPDTLRVMNSDPFDSENTQNQGRLSGFIHSDDDAVAKTLSSIRRSTSVKKLRMLLPLVAGLIVVVMFVWSDMESVAPPQRKEDVAPQSLGRNELLNPRFESEDASQQPYTITATKAFQDSKDLNLINLDKPVADISLKDNAWLAVESDKGKFEQVKQNLMLEGKVKLFHDDGYEMLTDKVEIDMIGEKAVSKTPVSGHGPIGTIKAQGLTADGKTGVLSFQGPATLILNQSMESK